METSTPLTAEQHADWTRHALSVFPNEACAFIIDGKVRPVANVSKNPTETFVTDAVEVLALRAEGECSGFLHSHPATPQQAGLRQWPTNWPTSHDMVGWLKDDVRWGISATDGEVVEQPVWLDEDYTAPLEGRHFIHGIWDCYSAVRDYFKVHKGITLKNYPRGMDWWHKGQDLYSDNFKDAGFVEVEHPEVGDCALMSIGARGVISHAAVLHSPNEIYHHTFSRTGEALSGYFPLNRWQPFIVKWVRFR